MAKASVYTKEKIEHVVTKVIVELQPEEASALAGLLGRTTGDEFTSLFNELVDKLYKNWDTESLEDVNYGKGAMVSVSSPFWRI